MRRANVVASMSLVLALAVVGVLPASAQKAASATTLKVGYFNLNLVKASSPDAAGSESLKNQAESQLRREVEEANKNLQKALSDKKPQEEVQKMAKEVQTEINAKQRLWLSWYRLLQPRLIKRFFKPSIRWPLKKDWT